MQELIQVRKRFTPDQRRQIVESYQQSSLTQSQFAAQAGISVSGLQQWLRQAAKAKADPTPFVQVPNLMATAVRPGACRLQLPNGVAVELRPGFDPTELRLLLGLAAAL